MALPVSSSPSSPSAPPKAPAGAPSSFERLPRQGLLLLAALALGWGFNWPVMKVVLSEVPPLYFRGSCLLLGGLGILAIARAGGGSIRVLRCRWGRLALVTVTNIIGWNVLAIYGVGLLPSGRAALLGYTMPLWSVLLSVWILGERLTVRRIVSLLLGLAGVAVLMGDSLEGMLKAPLGVACMVGAAWSWALGVVLLKRLPVGLSTTALTGWMMVLGGLPMLAAAIPLKPPASSGLPSGRPSAFSTTPSSPSCSATGPGTVSC
jgi:drug/metabolite transporter (DMT)-like permease